MKTPLRFLPGFFEDAAKIEGRYEEERNGLGSRFVAELDRTLDSLAELPDSFPLVDRTTRVAQIHPFAYGIYFRMERDVVVVMTIWHLHRRPGSWKRRRNR